MGTERPAWTVLPIPGVSWPRTSIVSRVGSPIGAAMCGVWPIGRLTVPSWTRRPPGCKPWK